MLFQKICKRLVKVCLILNMLILGNQVRYVVGNVRLLKQHITSGYTVFTGSTTAPATARVQPVGTMVHARPEHTATRLANGKVLLVGGRTDNDFVAQAELFDPSTNTFTSTGSLRLGRSAHAAALLPNGKVLIVGGMGSLMNVIPTSAELYDPVSGTFTDTGSLNVGQYLHAAISLSNNKVLVAGGGTSYFNPATSAELYDPNTGIFTYTGSMNIGRPDTVAVPLQNGKVLFVGGNDGSYMGLSTAELYDPVSGTFTNTGSMSVKRRFHAAALLTDGRVMVTGGNGQATNWKSAELYNPMTGQFTALPDMDGEFVEHRMARLGNNLMLIGGSELYDPSTQKYSRLPAPSGVRNTATTLNDGSVLITGICDGNPCQPNSAFRVIPIFSNPVTGSLSLPDGWISQPSAIVTMSAISAGAVLSAVALSNDNGPSGTWIPISPSVPVSTMWNFGGDGISKSVTLLVNDADDRVISVVSGTVNVDTTAPQSTMTPLLSTSTPDISLGWSGTDATSGIANYDVQIQVEPSDVWTDIIIGTSMTEMVYTGVPGQTYAFRVRARDVAGNVEDWPDSQDTKTTVDTTSPTGSVNINGGARATTSQNVTLTLFGFDALGPVMEMRISSDNVTWTSWQIYSHTQPYVLPGPSGLKSIYVQFRDQALNVSNAVSSSIRLDEDAGQIRLTTINTGTLWTNVVTVQLTIGSPPGTTEMQVSNDGGFGGAVWQPFDTRPMWQISSFGTYVLPRTVYVRLRLADGTISDIASDEIIYDPVPPTGSITVTTPSRVRSTYSGLAATSTVNVRLSASDPDNLSGVPLMRVANENVFAAANWEPFATDKALNIPSGVVVNPCAQFKDGAGNISNLVCLIPNTVLRNQKLFLPLTTRQ